jgi:AraC family transcriptional regulator
MPPLQFFVPEPVTRAQQLIHETKDSPMDIGVKLGYKNPRHFAPIFRRLLAVTPTRFGSAL